MSLQRGNFQAKPAPPWNVYECVNCRDEGKVHEVRDVRHGETDRFSLWGAGFPTTIRQCAGCQRADGPWVSAELVGGGW
jgi:hypothetical protein